MTTSGDAVEAPVSSARDVTDDAGNALGLHGRLPKHPESNPW
ncbi:hypothetical protein [Rhabdothermincola sediminis]|nr:hypothetical protein [Rhabdothermincola sediminis]